MRKTEKPEQGFDPRGGIPPAPNGFTPGAADYNDDDDDDDERSEADTLPKSGAFTRMFGVFYAPIKLFDNIRVHGGAAGPLTLIAVLSAVFAVLSYWYLPIVMREQYAAMTEVFGRELVDYIRAYSGDGNGPAQIITSGLGMLGGVALGALISSTVGIVVLKVMKSEIGFGKLFALFAAIASVDVLGQVLSVGMSVLTYSTTNAFSPAVFLSGSDAPGYHFLNSISLFMLFGMILTFLGTRALSGLPRKKAALAGLIVVLITYGTTIFLASQASDPIAAYEQVYRIIQMTQ